MKKNILRAGFLGAVGLALAGCANPIKSAGHSPEFYADVAKITASAPSRPSPNVATRAIEGRPNFTPDLSKVTLGYKTFYTCGEKYTDNVGLSTVDVKIAELDRSTFDRLRPYFANRRISELKGTKDKDLECALIEDDGSIRGQILLVDSRTGKAIIGYEGIPPNNLALE